MTLKVSWRMGYPLEQKIPDVNEPQSGYLWGNLASHGKTLYHFGEYISSVFCNDKNAKVAISSAGGGDAWGDAGMLAEGDCSGRSDSGGVGWGGEQVAVGDSAACFE